MTVHYNGRVINVEVKVTKWKPPTVWQQGEIRRVKETNSTVVALVPKEEKCECA